MPTVKRSGEARCCGMYENALLGVDAWKEKEEEVSGRRRTKLTSKTSRADHALYIAVTGSLVVKGQRAGIHQCHLPTSSM
jgi:hypothetical protein